MALGGAGSESLAGYRGNGEPRDPYGKRPGALWPEQAIDLATTLRIFTINGAVAGKQADRTGSLEVGKAADFIVLDRNLFNIPVEEIGDTQVVLTVIDGADVYRSNAWLEE